MALERNGDTSMDELELEMPRSESRAGLLTALPSPFALNRTQVRLILTHPFDFFFPQANLALLDSKPPLSADSLLFVLRDILSDCILIFRGNSSHN